MFCYAWVGQSYIRFYSQKNKYIDYASNILLRNSLLLGFCLFLPFSYILTPIGFAELLLFVPTFFLFGYYCYYILVFQAKQKAFLVMICEVLRTLINILLAIGLFKYFKTINPISILAIALFFSYLIPLFVLNFNNKKIQNSFKENEVNALKIQIKRYGIPISFFLSGSLALSVNDRFIISALVNKESAGIYSAIYDIVNKGAIAFFSPILMTFYPAIANLYNSNKEQEAMAKIKKLIIYEAVIMLMGFIVLIFTCPILLQIVLNEKSNINLQKVTYCIYVGVCLWQIAMLAHKPLELKQKTKFMATAVFISFIVNVALNYLLIKNSNSLIIPALTTIIGSIIYLLLVSLYFRSIKG